MNRCVDIFRTQELAAERFDHPPGHTHTDPVEEFSAAYSVNLVQRGDFSIQIGRRTWDVEPGVLFLTVPGMVYRCRHRDAFPVDRCLGVVYAPGNETWGTARLDRIARRGPTARVTNRIAYLFRSIPCLSSNVDARMAVENSAAELLDEVCREDATHCKLYKEHQLSWYAERVDAARVLLEMQYATAFSISDLARAVGMSTFHFARIFRELAGMPPHRYLLQVRMIEAARRLQQGASVTVACFAVGFHELGHFSRYFRHWFGVSPSKYRPDRPSMLVAKGRSSRPLENISFWSLSSSFSSSSSRTNRH